MSDNTQDKPPVTRPNPPVEVLTTSQQAAVNIRYIANHTSRVVFTMPTVASLGDQISIRGKGTGGWKLAQNANQVIHGASDSTVGTNGYIQSQTSRDTVVIECTTANTDFIIISNRGTLDIN